MKKIMIILMMLTSSALSFAKGVNSLNYLNEDIKPINLEEKSSQGGVRFSLRAGVHDWKDSKFIDTSYGIQGEINIELGDTPFDLNIRGFYQKTKYEDTYGVGYDYDFYGIALVEYATYAEYIDYSATGYGGSAQLKWNILKGEAINPYIAIGAMFEKNEIEYDEYILVASQYSGLFGYKRNYLDDYYYEVKESEDGITFAARFGLELDYNLLYARFEIAAIGEIYDNDDSIQAEISGVAGINITEELRIEAAANYFSEWEEYYLTGGISIGF